MSSPAGPVTLDPGQKAETADRDVDAAEEPTDEAASGAQLFGQRRRHGLGWVATPVLVAVVSGLLIWYLVAVHKDFAAQLNLRTGYAFTLLWQTVKLTLVATAIVIVIAVPLGIAVTRPALRRASPVILAIANIGQAIPSFGLIVLFAAAVGFGFWPAAFALVAYSLLPILRNTMVGLEQVDPALREAGRGVGLTNFQVLWRVELPLAVPVMLAGIRTAIILNVGTAVIAAYANSGGFGQWIVVGISQLDTPLLVAGAVSTALLALSFDWVAEVAERFLTPRGLQ